MIVGNPMAKAKRDDKLLALIQIYAALPTAVPADTVRFRTMVCESDKGCSLADSRVAQALLPVPPFPISAFPITRCPDYQITRFFLNSRADP
jgi:hypothetical protein